MNSRAPIRKYLDGDQFNSLVVTTYWSLMVKQLKGKFTMITSMSVISNNRENANSTILRSLIDMFGKRLTIVQANSKELLDVVFQLRFQVYCLERGFENAAEYPDGRERDDDDPRSTHFLVLYQPVMATENMAVGTVRLILPRTGADLPVLKLLAGEERRKINLPLESTAEVSRFAVPRAFRRRLEQDFGNTSEHASRVPGAARSALSLLNFWLIRAVVTMTANEGITHIVAMMEPALLRLLRPLGIEFHPMGQIIEHHGLRQPGWAALGKMTDRIRRYRPDLWELAFDAGWEVSADAALAHG
jgi:N-acyl amino acid synthase of PEP-CTERM/exosortase system